MRLTERRAPGGLWQQGVLGGQGFVAEWPVCSTLLSKSGAQWLPCSLFFFY